MKFRLGLTILTALLLLIFSAYCGYMVLWPQNNPVKVVEPESGTVEILGVGADPEMKRINAKILSGQSLIISSSTNEYLYFIRKANEAAREHPLILQGNIRAKFIDKMKDLYGKVPALNTIGTEEIKP